MGKLEPVDVQVESYVNSMWADRMRFGPKTPVTWFLGLRNGIIPYRVYTQWGQEHVIEAAISTVETAREVLEALKVKEVELRSLWEEQKLNEEMKNAFLPGPSGRSLMATLPVRTDLTKRHLSESAESVLESARAAYRRVELEMAGGAVSVSTNGGCGSSITKEMSDLWRGSMGGSRTIADALEDVPPMSRLHRMAEPHGYLSKIPGARKDWAPAQVVTYEQDLGEDLELSDAELRAWAKR